MTDESKPTCADCRFFQAEGPQQVRVQQPGKAPANGVLLAPESKVGMCRKRLHAAFTTRGPLGFFPPTQAGFWCGDHESARVPLAVHKG